MNSANTPSQQPQNPVPEAIPVRQDSYFDGKTIQLIGYRLLMYLVCLLTLGIAYPWMLCLFVRWETKHTVIHGRRLRFDGRGGQLIGRYLLWSFLTLITLGIYGIWLGLGMKRWVVKHTFYADDENPVASRFSGGAGGFFGFHLLAGLITFVTLGIGKFWGEILILRWETRHTHIGGSPLEFRGSGGSLFAKYLLLYLLTPLTLGIYAIFWPVRYRKWKIRNTEAVYQTERIQSQAKAHEIDAIKDAAKFRIAATEQDMNAVKSGHTGNESLKELETAAENGNPFACYRLATVLKEDSPLYEGRALDLLQTAANGKVHAAMYDLAMQLPTEQSIPMLAEAARCGNIDASWCLAKYYCGTDDLFSAAYWFRVAIEWEHPEAVARRDEYDRLVTDLALALSESFRNTPEKEEKSSGKALPIVFGILGGLVALALISVLCVRIFSGKFPLFNGGSQDNRPGSVVAMSGNSVIFGGTDIDGEEYDRTTSDGKHIRYVCDSDAFFDRDNGKLYLDFALFEYDGDYIRIGRNGWKTAPIYPNSGISAIHISGSDDFGDGETELYIYGPESDEATDRFVADITSGGEDDAKTWFEEKKGTDIPEDPTVPSVSGDLSEFVGEWSRIYYSGNDLVVAVRTLKSDGNFSEKISVYTPVSDDYEWIDLVYGGRSWAVNKTDEANGGGSYSVSEEKLVFNFGGNSEEYGISRKNGVVNLGGNDGWKKVSPLVGTWMSAEMVTQDIGSGNTETELVITSLTFNVNGMFYTCETYRVWIEPEDYEEGGPYSPVDGTKWYIPAVGVPGCIGSYDTDGTNINMHYIRDDVGGAYDEYRTYRIDAMSSGKQMVLNGKTYYKGTYSIPQLCDLFGYPVN